MKELKFRSWDGYYFYHLDLRTDDDMEFRHFYSNINIDSPIEQYTGLKDKYGKEIYEGDIIGVETCIDEEEITTYEVYWDENALEYALRTIKGINYDSCVGELSSSSVRIIGNIHEYPPKIVI